MIIFLEKLRKRVAYCSSGGRVKIGFGRRITRTVGSFSVSKVNSGSERGMLICAGPRLSLSRLRIASLISRLQCHSSSSSFTSG
ncbi:MAG: hypothetical protein VB068_09635, partial [Petrimonas sp.]|nr:hypothetical protein [Petrimonas sp.]